MSTPSFPRPQFIALLLTCALLTPSLMLAQTVAPETRPRRVQPERPFSMPVPDASGATTLTRLSAEPIIRIGLSTNARSVAISTAAASLSVAREQPGETPAPVPLTVARVRIEPRLLTPLAPSQSNEAALFRVEIATAAATQAQAASVAREVQELTNETPEVRRDANSQAWLVRVGAPVPRGTAEELCARLEEAGIASVAIVAVASTAHKTQTVSPSQPRETETTAATKLNPAASGRTVNQPTANARHAQSASNARHAPTRATQPVQNGVRLTSLANAPARGLVVYAAGATPLLDARTPVTFAPTDASAPVRFNEKPYRGRLEVFTNLNGSLTVVNVIGLEDYVRGVVPNELSPGGYGALEALKAQAVAARTYAVSNRGQFNASGFDLLPTIRSQVYGGLSTEHPLSTRAVEETRGIIATFNGAPINALYTSTCGGRTENAENIFGGEVVPYLRGRVCSTHAAPAALAPNIIQTTREPNTLRAAEHALSARETALLAVHGYRLPARINDEWLATSINAEEARGLFEVAAHLARRAAPAIVNSDVTRPPAFSSALALAIDGESRADVLLSPDDISYLLAFRDADDIPAQSRADVAMLVRYGNI